MKSALPWLLIPLALLGIWFGMDLTDAHFTVKYEPNTDMDQWCDVSGTFNCTAVARSKYSHISLSEDGTPIPVSLPAVGFFALLALLGGLAGLTSDQEKRNPILALAALVLVPALAFSLYLLAVQVFALKTFCIKCLLLDATVLGAFIVAIVSHGGGMSAVMDSMKRIPKGTLVIALLLGLVVNGVYWSSYSGKVDTQEAKNAAIAAARGDSKPKDDHAGHGHAAGEGHEEEKSLEDLSPAEQEEVKKQLAEILAQARAAIGQFYSEYETFPKKELDLNSFDGVKGSTDALVRVVEFADFECPHCQMAAPQVKDIVERYGDKVEVVFKNYPLGKKCNADLSRDMHPDACEAAVAVQCAGRQGSYWEMHDIVFATAAEGESIGTRRLKKIAEKLNLDKNQFGACLTDDTAWNEVREQVADGKAAGISGTPSFFVNGVQMPSPHPAFVEAAVRRELIAKGVTDLPPDQDGVFGN
ncbi:MAG: thioredoxin domain-containing protein [Deltaproteobacteria bacterium]|nr:thioredoxin domain-containing protein [Deltaproteobacteria bacterium]